VTCRKAKGHDLTGFVFQPYPLGWGKTGREAGFGVSRGQAGIFCEGFSPLPKEPGRASTCVLSTERSSAKTGHGQAATRPLGPVA